MPGPAPPGTITAPGPFTLDVNSTFGFTAGAHTAPGSGGVITLSNGTITTTSTSGIGAQGVVSQSGTITGTNVNVTTSGLGSYALEAQLDGQVIWNGGTINGGSGSGSTVLVVHNTGGPGVETVNNGILVVDAINGGTTTLTAFQLAGGRVTAGAFDYFLFRGGITPGTDNSWFLRNAIVAPPVTPPGATPPGVTPIPTPTPAPGTPPLPTPVPGDPPIPLYDPEVSLKSVVPSVARTRKTIIIAGSRKNSPMSTTVTSICSSGQTTSTFCPKRAGA